MYQDLLNAVALGSVYLLFAIGMSVTWGTIGILNMAHGAIFMASAFTVHVIASAVALSPVLYVLMAVLVGAAISTATQVLVFRPILKRAATHHAAEVQILIGGIGVSAIPVGVAEIVTKGQPFGFNVSAQIHNFDLGFVRITETSAIVIVLALVIAVSLAVWIRRSKQGLALRAIGVDAEVAALMGVDKVRLSVATMAVAGGLAGLAGALLTIQLTAITPSTGDSFLIKAFAAIVLGGVGSIAGVVLGSYLLALSEIGMTLAGAGSWANATSFAAIFLVLLFRPRGIFGRREVRRT